MSFSIRKGHGIGILELGWMVNIMIHIHSHYPYNYDRNHENIISLNWWLRYAEISLIKCIRNPNDILLFRNSKVGYRVKILCILSLENQYCLSLGGFVFVGFGENGDFGCCKSVTGFTYNLIFKTIHKYWCNIMT